MYDFLQHDWLKMLYILTIVFMVILVIQQRGDPMKTIAWLMVVTFLPLLGIFLYFFFGKNYRKEKIFSRKELTDSQQIKLLKWYHPDEADVTHWHDKAVADKVHIMKMLYNSDKVLLTERNRVKILVNGKMTFEHIFAELEKAKIEKAENEASRPNIKVDDKKPEPKTTKIAQKTITQESKKEKTSRKPPSKKEKNDD